MYAHVGLNVTNLEKSIAFYTKLFGTPPVKVKPDYAKFVLEDPGLNFTLNLRPSAGGNQVSHFGFQVADTDAVQAHRRRLEEAGIPIGRDEQAVACCYAVQDKFWVTDPDGNEWEFFFTRQDIETNGPSGSPTACCV